MEKQCSICKEFKPISEFYKHKWRKDGVSSSCKQCDKRVYLERYQKAKDANHNTPKSKVCVYCKKEKPITEFSISHLCKDGHLNKCKDCQRVYNAKYFATHIHPLADIKSKVCKRCEVEKDISQFGLDKHRIDGHNRYCKDCEKLYRREAKLRNPNRMSIMNKKHRYGLSKEQYESMLQEQNGVCAICGNPETFKIRSEDVSTLSVDHDHATGEIRGLLCAFCNHGLGSFRDSPDLLIRAAEYLRKYQIVKEQTQ